MTFIEWLIELRCRDEIKHRGNSFGAITATELTERLKLFK